MQQNAARCQQPGGAVCVDDNVVACGPNGALGAELARCAGGCNAGKCVETCGVQDVELVYVIDTDHVLRSFDPKKLPNDPFRTVGKLACAAHGSPFSMAVDRRGVAWINYAGTVYRVSILDGTCLQARRPSGAPSEFGMGFVSDGAERETLYAAGYHELTFASLDVSQQAPPWRPIGTFATRKNPELSGTSAGQLYGFFPENGDDGFVQEIDRATGALIGKRLPVGAPRGSLGGWAFAHWGGKFYVFVTIDERSQVYEVDGKTGTARRVLDNLPSRIVGAGVSTCAPLLESQ